MKKKTPPRLTLKRETIRELEKSPLGWVAGASAHVEVCGPNSNLFFCG